MRVLSLFDGMSCGQLALERAGIEVDQYFASEIDKNAISITMKNFPDTVQLGNVENWKEWELPSIDLLIGGSPCQGFSRQGTQLNFEHPQSKLFFEYVDVLHYVKPKYFLLENVLMRTEWKDVITNYLQVEPININSKLVSAQNRPRTYWTNIPIEQPEDKGIILNDILDQDVEVDYIDHQGVKVCKSFSENSINLINVIAGEVRISQSTVQGYIVAEDGDGVNLSFPTSKSRRARVVKKKTSTIDTACNIGVFTNNIIRRITINELEKLQTLPVGYTDCLDEKARRKAIGNGWTVDVVKHIFEGLKVKELVTL